MSANVLTREAAAAIAWERGLLDYKLDEDQVTMRRVLRECLEPQIVVNCSRQKGKSFWLCVEAAEFAIRFPGSEIKYAAPTAKMVRKIIRPHFRTIFRDCPKHLRPVFNSQDGEYRFPNGSVITVAGTDKDNVESLRGQHAHLCIIDEAGFMDDLEYIIKSVLGPQLTNTGGRIIIASTPAKTPGHAFKDYCDAAEAAPGVARREYFGETLEAAEGTRTLIGYDAGAYIHRTIYTNPRLDRTGWARQAKLAGGIESTDWKREYLCEHVTDTKSAVLQAATEARLRACTLELDAEGRPASPRRPPLVQALEAGDLGFAPHKTGWLFAEWWYEHATLVIVDELLLEQATTRSIADAVKGKELELWPSTGPAPSYRARRAAHQLAWEPHKRVSDVDLRLQADLQADHGLSVISTAKDNLEAAVNTVNLMLLEQKGALRIHPRCKQLRRQMKNAIWNKQRTEFAEDRDGSHFDLIAALIYLCRNIDRELNPYPPGYHQAAGPNRLVSMPETRTSGLAAGLAGLIQGRR